MQYSFDGRKRQILFEKAIVNPGGGFVVLVQVGRLVDDDEKSR
jgi:hypothetical protein